MLAMAECQSTLMQLIQCYREQALLLQKEARIHQITGKKKPDLAKAFNRANALRSRSARGDSMRVQA
ncbi:hypothetical protein DKY63_12775 [Pseudomonas putida]|uniref:Uncharacterized protein n=1 Tax=Pseudomonas putida TaxID=303 RepID=A0A2Z4RIC4_PSEPU|nr:hypothetical protein DKY63_12775 [Pseudomonas putida]